MLPADKKPPVGSDWRLKFLHKVGVAEPAAGGAESGDELHDPDVSTYRAHAPSSSGSVSGAVTGEGILSSSVSVVVRQASQARIS